MYEAYLKNQAEAERREQEKRKQAYEAAKAKAAQREAQVDKLLADKKYAEARDLAWKTGPAAIRRAVLTAVRADQTDHLTSVDLSEAWLGASGAESLRVEKALQAAQVREAHFNARRSEGESSSSSGSSGSSASAPSASSGRSVQSIIDNARWQSQLNYLSGRQGWGYLDNNTIRR